MAAGGENGHGNHSADGLEALLMAMGVNATQKMAVSSSQADIQAAICLRKFMSALTEVR